MQNFTSNAGSLLEKHCDDEGQDEITLLNVSLKTNAQMPVDLLDMLAEVASKSLQHDPSLASPSKLHLTESKRARNTASRLLNLFSKFDGDEMRRRFTFTCMFDVGGCAMTFSSFGSELKARQSMKLHLLDHAQQAGATTDRVFKPGKIQGTTRKSLGSKGSAKSYLAYDHPDSISKHTLHKNVCRVKSNCKIQSDETSAVTKSTLKLQQHNFTHICESPKCDKPNRNVLHPYFYVAHDEHNYTAPKINSAEISLDLPFVSNADRRLTEIVDVHEDNNALSSLNSFMVDEAHYLNVLVTCLENNNNSQLTKLPSVGKEVSVITTFAPVSSTPKGKAEKHNFNLAADTKQEKHPAEKLTDEEMAIKLIGEAKNKRSSQPLHCTICKPHRHFTALTTLISHYRSHAGIRPFKCLVCHRSFTRQHSLKYHLLIHQNATRFTCSHCSRKFRHPAHFREHLRKHTGEEPFHCCDCTARFKTRNTFKRHLRSRHSKVLTASGEMFQLEEEIGEMILQPGDGSQSASGGQNAPPAETLGSKPRDLAKENTLDMNADANGSACFEENSEPSMWSPSDIIVGVIMEEISRGDASMGNTRDLQSNDGNNNATKRSAFFVVDKDTSQPSI